eukprot:jgi/Chrzof1/13316/Cz07g28200.t1
MFTGTRELSSRTVVLCAQYGVGGDLSLQRAPVVCFVSHTQPHFTCPVLSVDLPCLTSYNQTTKNDANAYHS